MKLNTKKKTQTYYTDMKKALKKIFIILILLFTNTINSFGADFKFSNSFISDEISVFQPIQRLQLNDVLKNFKNETGTDFAIIVLRKLGENEKFKDIEEQVRTQFVFGGESKENWIMVILTQEPYRMNIRVGKDLRKTIPRSMIRSLILEFNLNKIISQNRNRFNYGIAARNLYSTSLYLAEAVADTHNKRLHTSAEYIVLEGAGRYQSEPELYIPRTDNMIKFLRRHNLFPTAIVLLIGIFPFLPRRRRYSRFW